MGSFFFFFFFYSLSLEMFKELVGLVSGADGTRTTAREDLSRQAQ